MILLATNISNREFDKAKAAGFADTKIMKPLRASMVGACLQQVERDARWFQFSAEYPMWEEDGGG